MRKLSGSRLPIFQHCQWWSREDVEYPERIFTSRQDDEADDGSARHEAIAAFLLSGEAPDDPELAGFLLSARQEIARSESQVIGVEVAIALNMEARTSRILGQNIGREYEAHGLQPGEIPLTLDLVLRRGDQIVVVDYKTGFGAHVKPPEENWQMLAGALAFARQHPDIRLEIWFLKEGKKPWVEGTDVDLFEILTFEDQLRLRLKLAPTSSPNAGEHCGFCEACGACPATDKALSKVVEPAMGFGWSASIQSVEHAQWMVEHLPLVKKALEAIEGALKKKADELGGIPMSDGAVWKAIECSTTRLNMAAVKRVLGERLPEYQVTSTFSRYQRTVPEEMKKSRRKKKTS